MAITYGYCPTNRLECISSENSQNSGILLSYSDFTHGSRLTISTFLATTAICTYVILSIGPKCAVRIFGFFS